MKIGMPELIIILVIVLLIFGAGKLPEIGGAMGKAIREFRSGFSDKGDKKSEAQPEEKRSDIT